MVEPETISTAPPLGDLLRAWRAHRGLSQLALALTAEVSSRHVSFVETGRSQPSREMVRRLSAALALPLRDRNALLVAAGYAPLYGERSLDAAGLEPVRGALELILERHEPYPAFVLDSGWNILFANRAHERMLAQLLRRSPSDALPVGASNAIRLVFDPELLRPAIANWDVVAHVLGHRLRRQLQAPGVGVERRVALGELLAFPDVERAMREVEVSIGTAILVPLEIELGDHRTAWFSTLATIGTALDVTLQEIVIESLFPADETTAALARGAALGD